ncbi:FxSxx-COOH system tetratricopeptide repeat protein, partial [Saccharothrix hoggarensis]
MADPLRRVLTAIGKVYPDVDVLAVADALWLGSTAGNAAGSHGAPVGVSNTSPTKQEEPSGIPARATRTGRLDQRETATPEVHERLATSTDVLPGREVTVAPARPLANSLAFGRAFHPFTRPWLRGTRSVLDIEATVDAYASSGILTPVMTPEPERWFDVVVIRDTTASMAVWREEIISLTALVRGMGAFRSTHNWKLNPSTSTVTDDRGVQVEHPSGRVAVPGGRRLVLLISDFASPGWRSARVWELVHALGSTTPTLLVNPLPPHLWAHSGLDHPSVRVLADTPGVRNTALKYHLPLWLRALEPETDWLPIPVVGFTAPGFARWAKALMRGDPEGCGAVLLNLEWLELEVDEDATETPIVELVDAFLHTASPPAARLAVLCSPLERFSLPLLNLIRQASVAEADLTDVAEFLVSGLLETEHPDPDHPVMSFRPEAAARLRTHLTYHDAWRTFDALTRHIAASTPTNRATGSSSLSASAVDPTADTLVPAEPHPFAAAAAGLRHILTRNSRTFDNTRDTRSAPEHPDRAATAWDLFISYTQDDRQWAEWIAWELEEAGHRVLIQAWDIVPGSNWVATMQEGVQQAECTIAVLSSAYTLSTYGAAEWEAAWRDAPLGKNRKLLVLRVEDCDRPGLLGSAVSEDLFDIPAREARARLLRVVQGATERRLKPGTAPGFPDRTRAVVRQPRFPGALPEVWNVPARNPNFTGRGGALARLRQAMRSPGALTVHSLRGLGGVGKSQLVIEYVHRFAADFDLVWWIPAQQPALIPDHLAGLGAALGLDADADPETTAAGVLAELRGRRRWLLVFDNAEDAADLRPYMPSGDGRVLVTTRRQGFRSLGPVLDVDVLDRAESVALLRRRVPGVTDDTAGALAEWLGDLPLALEQASAYLEATDLPVAAYLDLLRTRTAEMFGRGRVAGREETLATLWDLSLTALDGQDRAAVQLLDLLAWMAPEPVPLDLFTAHPQALPAPLAEAAADPYGFAETVGTLVGWFLARRSDDEVTIAHRLLQHSLRARTAPTASTQDSMSPASVVQELLAADLPGEIVTAPENWPRWRALLPHVLAVYENTTTIPSTTGHTVWLLDRAATYLQTHGAPSQALSLFERALAIDEAVYGPDHPEVATRLNNLGHVLSDLGRPGDAQPLLERALAITEAAYGPDHPEVATRLNNLGHVLSDLGRPGDA